MDRTPDNHYPTQELDEIKALDELDLEELFFHLRAKGNEIQSN
jgi:hypothetical protein